MNCTLFSIYF